MSKRKYKPYSTRKQGKQRQLRKIIIILIVLIVGVVFVIRKYMGNESATTPDTGGQERRIEDLMSNDNGADAESETVTTPESQPAPTPIPVETQPLADEEPITPTEVATPESEAPVAEVPAIESSDEARSLVEQAIELDKAGKIIDTRILLNAALEKQLSPSLRIQIKTKLTKLADKWLFGREVFESDHLTEYYLVQPGEALSRIAPRYKVPHQILQTINGIPRPEALQAGQKIKVIKGPFNAVVYKSTFTMDLYLQRTYIKTYKVGIGKEGHDTPAGRWRLKSGEKSDRQPPWTDPETKRVYVNTDPDYPLGTRWIPIEGLDVNTEKRTGFALHGTKDPESIGTRSSRGCIRLHNDDVEEVYDLLRAGVSEIIIYD